MYFFGVTTGRSSSRKMFPEWTKILGLEGAQLVGVDLPINAPVEQYRQAVYQIKADPLSLGALVTTHKLNVLRAAGDYFDELTPDAALCEEVSYIYKRDGRLIGHAGDPTTSGLAIEHFVPAGHWTTHAEADVLCLGTGGAAIALVTYLSTRRPAADRPRRVVLVDRSQDRLDNMAAMLGRLPETNIDFELVLNNDDPTANDRLMASLPAHSLVINATGMGKDTPGSPITDQGLFPLHGLVWEYNYRGELDFWHQARAQAAARQLTVEDGWVCFLHGWSDCISHVFDVALTPELFGQLGQAAEAIR